MVPKAREIKENKFLIEYPFAEFVTMSDMKINSERLQSAEVNEHIEI